MADAAAAAPAQAPTKKDEGEKIAPTKKDDKPSAALSVLITLSPFLAAAAVGLILWYVIDYRRRRLAGGIRILAPSTESVVTDLTSF